MSISTLEVLKRHPKTGKIVYMPLNINTVELINYGNESISVKDENSGIKTK